MSRDRYLARAQSVLDEAHRRIKEGIEPCSRCHHSRKNISISRQCVHPIVLIAQRNIVNNDLAVYQIGHADYQRGVSDHYGPVVCGPDGELFEPIVGPRSILQKIFNWFHS